MSYESKNVFLGPLQFRILSTIEASGRERFSFKQVLESLFGVNRQSLRNALHKLVAKGRLHRIKKGEYLLVPFKEEDYTVHELSLANDYYPGGYVSFLSALRFHGLTDRLPVAVQVAVRKPAVKHLFQETRFEPVKLSERYFLGYKTIQVGGGSSVRMALKEKAILDCLLHPEYCGGVGEACNALNAGFKELDWKSIEFFLHRMNSSSLERRLRYCLKFIGRKSPLPEKKFEGYRKLDAFLPSRGGYDSKFGLRINVDLEEETR